MSDFLIREAWILYGYGYLRMFVWALRYNPPRLLPPWKDPGGVFSSEHIP